jgi:hypothetical protein
MNSNRCFHCGFLNFASAEVCKRCQAPLAPANQYEANEPEPGFNPYWNNQANNWGVQPGAYWNAPPPPAPPAGVAGGQIAALVFILLAAYFLKVYLFLDSREGCGSMSTAYELGRFTGYLLIIALGCYIIWRFLCQRTKRRLVLNLFMLAVGVLSAWQINSEYNALRVTKATVRRLIGKNGGLSANTGFLQKDTSPYPGGRFERVGRMMEDYIIDLHNESAAYMADVEAVGIDTFLAPESLVNLQNLQRKRQQLAGIMASMDMHEARIKQLANQGDEALSNAPLEGCIEREFVMGTRMALASISRQASELFVIQREIFKEIDKFLAFLEEKNGKYSAGGDQLLFSSGADKLEYGFFQERLNELAEREEQLVDSVQRKQAEAFKGLETFVR